MKKAIRMAVAATTISGSAIADTPAANSLSDSEMSKLIVGSWTPSDFGPPDRFVIETWAPDGTDFAVWYTDSTCKKVASREAAKWVIQNGWLVITFPDGAKYRDKIVSIGAESLKTFAVGALHTMYRGTSCGTTVS